MRIVPVLNTIESNVLEGENLAIMRMLLCEGYGGRFKMIYFDGPFNSGLLFSFLSQKFEFEYIPPWSQHETIHNAIDPNRYLENYRERVMLAKELLSEDGIFVLQTNQLHGHHIKVMLDDVFGRQNMMPEVIWKHSSTPWDVIPGYPVGYQHEALYFYSKSSQFAVSGSFTSVLPSIWDDIPGYGSDPDGEGDYPSQKPEKLAERIIDIMTIEGDLVGDFYCGSGSFAVAAARKGRRWLACDSSAIAARLTRERLSANSLPYRTHVVEDEFEPANLINGVYRKTSALQFSALELTGLLVRREEAQIEVHASRFSPDIDLVPDGGRVQYRLVVPAISDAGPSLSEKVTLPRPILIREEGVLRLHVPNPIDWVLHHLILFRRNERNQMIFESDEHERLIQWDNVKREAEAIAQSVNGDWIAMVESRDGLIKVTDIFGYQYKIADPITGQEEAGACK